MSEREQSGPDRRRVAFRGRVQGVGFRATCVSIARGYPLTGWVRNEPDGSVRLEAQGAAADLDRFVGEILRTMGANVSEHASAAAPLRPDERGFRIAD